MMLGEGNQLSTNPMVHAPPWGVFDESTAGMAFPLPVSGVANNNNNSSADYSPFVLGDAFTALQRYLPSNDIVGDDPESEISDRETDIPVDTYSCDEFRMYEFKVRRCARGRSHDWTECPYAHPGEKARRRDPRRFHYAGTACPDFRKGNCKRGDACEFAHGVFECWLHPARYRTQPCKDGTSCRRRVCFFAHTQEQLRVLPHQQSPRAQMLYDSYDGSPLRYAMSSSPTSTLISPPISPSDSPPLSPISPISPSLRRSLLPSNSVNEVLVSLRQLQLSKAKSVPATWGVQIGGGAGIGSPRGAANVGPSFSSLPSTPTRVPTKGLMELWEMGFIEEEQPAERVESGRDLRAKIYEKLSKENKLSASVSAVPDVGWVSELVK
eukprot:TRINITY_DN1000_c0_g1_i2.p1 TRINITY_DN1000_c0_g1~~TRINITY_DN1000_c0_g1_i2.p1  ORF type:complete len:382 (-),score=10.44 TRINITY_DN1000_c0_g1_i2:216-1361(-)